MKPASGLLNSLATGNKELRHLLHIFLIVLVGVTVYLNTFQVPFVLDDASIGFLGKKSLPEILLYGGSRFVADFTFALNYHIHGLQITGYHAVNLVIHLSSSVVLYFVMAHVLTALRFSSPPGDSAAEETAFVEQFIPLATALFFVAHPIQTQAVTYIIQRYTSLATFFYLVSVLFFIRARLSYEKSDTYRHPLLLGSFSLIAAILALGSKQIAVTLPVMMLFLEIFLFRGHLITRRFYIICGALFVLALVSVLVMWRISSIESFLYNLHLATSEDPRISRTTYFLTQTRVVVTYLRLLCLPFGQSLMYDYTLYAKLFELPVIASLALHISLITTALVLFIKSGQYLSSHDRGKGVLQRLVSLGIAWFYLALSVESSIFPIRDVIFEQRIYLPSVGFFMAVTAGTALAVRGRRAGFKAAWSLVAVACLVLGGLTLARNQVWRNSLTLWEDTVRKYPDKPLALANLAGVYVQRNMPDKAIPLFVKALELGADFQAFQLGEAMMKFNMYESRFTSGREFMRQGGVMGSGLLDDSDKIKYESVIYNTLALAYESLGDPDSALKYYGRSLQRNAEYDLAWYNLSLLYVRMGDKKQAGKALDRLKILNPSLAGTLVSALHH